MPTTTSTTTCPDCDGCIGSISVKSRTLPYHCSKMFIPKFQYGVCAGGCFCQFENFTILTVPTHGTLKIGSDVVEANDELTLLQDGTMTYQAESGYSGNDSFTWNVVLSCGTSATGTVNIIVQECSSSPCCT